MVTDDCGMWLQEANETPYLGFVQGLLPVMTIGHKWVLTIICSNNAFFFLHHGEI